MVAYVVRFKEPDESDWPSIAQQLSKELGYIRSQSKMSFRGVVTATRILSCRERVRVVPGN